MKQRWSITHIGHHICYIETFTILKTAVNSEPLNEVSQYWQLPNEAQKMTDYTNESVGLSFYCHIVYNSPGYKFSDDTCHSICNEVIKNEGLRSDWKHVNLEGNSFKYGEIITAWPMEML